MSADKQGSDISILNKFAGVKINEIHSDTYFVLKKTCAFAKMTGGAVDITMKPVTDLWRDAAENGIMPIESELLRARGLVNYKDVHLEQGKFGASLKRKCMAVDLGAAIKGYAVDEASKTLLNAGVQNAVMDFGGSVCAMGSRPDGGSWKVGVHSPEGGQNDYLGALALRDMSVATSSINRGTFVIGGIKYHLIIDPKTGYPCQSGLLSVTVAAKNGIDADGYATALCVMGLSQGMELVSTLDGVEAIFVTDDHKAYVTRGIRDGFVLYDTAFSLKS